MKNIFLLVLPFSFNIPSQIPNIAVDHDVMFNLKNYCASYWWVQKENVKQILITN